MLSVLTSITLAQMRGQAGVNSVFVLNNYFTVESVAVFDLQLLIFHFTIPFFSIVAGISNNYSFSATYSSYVVYLS